MKARQYDTFANVEIDGKSIETCVYFNYSPGWSGSYWEPPEPSEVEILKVENLENKEDVFEYLTNEQIELLIEKCNESAYDQQTDYDE